MRGGPGPRQKILPGHDSGRKTRFFLVGSGIFPQQADLFHGIECKDLVHRMTFPSSLADLLSDCFALQDEATERWPSEEPAAPEPPALAGPEVSPGALSNSLRALVLDQHLRNFRLWHVEDTARRRDVDDAVIADCKRRIDVLNQERNDRMERVDACLVALLRPFLPEACPEAYNTESPGMAIDRLSILSLKIWHMAEQTRREDASPDHIAACREKLAVLHRQRQDLAAAVQGLMAEYLAGTKRPGVYFQFKMYNDPNLNPQLYAPRG